MEIFVRETLRTLVYNFLFSEFAKKKKKKIDNPIDYRNISRTPFPSLSGGKLYQNP